MSSKTFHQFEHPAMNTVFTFRFRGVDAACAGSAAGACIIELEQLEGLLSRYREGSDVARINALAAGQILFVSERCHECLMLAARAQQETGGLFDATQGALYEHGKRGHPGAVPKQRGILRIDPARPLLVCEEPGCLVDLGGIGKGFALDRLATTLRELGVADALLSAGASTHLALAGGAWSVRLSPGDWAEHFPLRGAALSVSGTAIQGAHVIHPFAESKKAAFRRLWLVHPIAALADAFSTAALLMMPEELEEFRRSQPLIRRIETEA